MGLIQKFRAGMAAKRIVDQLGGTKKGWKTLVFWVALLGNLATLAASLKGMVSPEAYLVSTTAIAAVYTILRGALKSEQTGVTNWWTTSEFWLSVGTGASGALLALQQGGINPAWLGVANTVLGASLTAARDLSHKQPEQPPPPAS